MDDASLSVLVMLPLIAVLAPILATVIGRVVRIPLVVFEIVLGILFGPALLGWMTPTDTTGKLSDLGLCMLFFLAGNEIDFGKIRGRPLNRSIVGWLVALVAGVVVGVLLAPNAAAGIFIGIALTSTDLGTLMPILRDAGELRTPFGTAVIALGAVGEFGPLIAISLFLSGREPGVATLILLAFVVVASIAIYLAGRGPFPRLHSLITTTLHTSGQFAIRLVLLLLLLLVALSVLLGVDMLLGAFAAGGHRQAAAVRRGSARPGVGRGQARGGRLRVPGADLLHQHRPDLRLECAGVRPEDAAVAAGIPGAVVAGSGIVGAVHRAGFSPRPTSGPSSCSAQPACRSSWRSPTSASATARCHRAPRPHWSAPGCCRCCCSR